jgi:hypothetical protein
MPETQSLDEIVSSAVASAPEALKDVIQEEPQQPTVERPIKIPPPEIKEKEETTEKPKEPTAEDEKDEFGFTKQDQIEAKQLLAALRDPEKAPLVVEFLASRSGYIKQPETKKEATEQAKTITDELAEALGPELKYIADKMGPIIEKRLKDSVDSVKGSTEERLARVETEKLQEKAAVAQDKVAKDYFKEGQIPEKLAKTMSKVMDTLHPAAGQTMEDHFEEVLIVAARRDGVTLSKISKQQKIEKNRNDVPSRMASDATNKPAKQGEVVLHPQRQMSLADAVAAAVQQSAKEMEGKT